MNHLEKDICFNIVKKLEAKPLNMYFLMPATDLPDYTKIIEKPMDFSTVKKKIENNEYHSMHEWYEDVILIYKNGMKFNEGNIIANVSQYCMEQFESLARGIECTDSQKWYELASHQLEKLAKVAIKSPIPQGIDPMIANILKKADTMPPLTPQCIADTVERLNRTIENTETRKDVFIILKETQPDLQWTSNDITIDAEKLNDTSKNALFLYVKAHS